MPDTKTYIYRSLAMKIVIP